MQRELTNYELWQLDKYGTVAPLTEVMPDGTFENGVEEMARLSEWVEMQAERQLYEHELDIDTQTN